MINRTLIELLSFYMLFEKMKYMLNQFLSTSSLIKFKNDWIDPLGASSGIGAGTARHFASLGSDLALTGRNKDNLEKTKTEIENAGHGVKIHLIVADLAKEEDCRRVVDNTIETFGKLDILVNNAGILTRGTVENTPLSEYDEIMNINVRSVFLLMQLSIPHLRATKGSIVNVSSVTGLRAVSIIIDNYMTLLILQLRYKQFPGVVGYNMTKAAVDQLTRTAALELASDGIRVNAVKWDSFDVLF